MTIIKDFVTFDNNKSKIYKLKTAFVILKNIPTDIQIV